MINRKHLLTALAASLLALPLASPSLAQSTWDGDAANLLWNDPNNWNLNTLPASGADVFFTGNVGTVLLNTSPTIGTLNMTVATGETIAFNTTGAARDFTINTGITTTGSAGTLTINPGTSPNFLSLVLGGNNAWNIGRNLSANSVITDGVNSYSITKTGAGALTLAAANTFDGGIVHRSGFINLTGTTHSANLGTGTFTFANLSGGSNNTLALNTSASKTITNNIVNDNAAAVTGIQYASIAMSGGLSGNRIFAFSGAFSTGANYRTGGADPQALHLQASTGDTVANEGTIVFSGDWSGYNAGTGTIRLETGSVLIDSANSFAVGGTYQLRGNSANVATKLILGGNYTMTNAIQFAVSGSGAGLRNGLGSRNAASTTATVSGTIAVTDADGANFFSQNTGAILDLSGVISGAGAVEINRGYTFTSANGVNANNTPTGTVRFSGASANTYTTMTTVSAGTLELSKTAGVNAIAGNVTVASGATLLVSASNQVTNSSAVTLSGGTITRGSGVSETFGTLNLTTDSTLNFGSGTAGNFTFGIYEDGTTPSHKLTVTNFFVGNTLVFGSDIGSFIAASSAGPYNGTYFAFDQGFTTTAWNGTSFTITAIPETSTVVAALGLAGLMLWPMRRRLFRGQAAGSRH